MTTPDPSLFTSSVVKPPDFDQYWAETQAATDVVPLNQRLALDEMRSTDEIEVFEARYDSYEGVEIAGWYARPRHFDGELPGYLFVPGYVSEPKLPNDLALRGYAAFSAAPRGKLRSNGVFNPGYPGLLVHNIAKREEYGYRGFYMDAVRAFDFLAGLDEVDDARIGVQGGSQGGALTLLVASLRPDQVACGSAGAPYLCSMMDSAALTHSYPYEEINDYLRIHPDQEAAVRETLDLHDIHNFVDRIKCPMIVSVGMQDDVVPPETGFAVFDQIGSSDKQFYSYEDCGHDAGTGDGHVAIVDAFMDSHLSPGPIGGAA
jgi:cephalosporin-C deacetylase